MYRFRDLLNGVVIREVERKEVDGSVGLSSVIPTNVLNMESEVMESEEGEGEEGEVEKRVSEEEESEEEDSEEGSKSMESEQMESKQTQPNQTQLPTSLNSSEEASSTTTPPIELDSEIATETPLVVKEEEPIYVDPTESMPLDATTPSKELPKEYSEDSPNSSEPQTADPTDIPNHTSSSTRYRPRFGRRFGRLHVSSFSVNSSYFPRDHVSDQLVASLIQRTANQERKVLNLLPRESRALANIISHRVDHLRPLKRIPAGLLQTYQQMTRGNEGAPLRNAAKIRRRSKNSEFLVIRKFRGNVEEREIALENRTEPRGSETDVTAIMVSTCVWRESVTVENRGYFSSVSCCIAGKGSFEGVGDERQIDDHRHQWTNLR